MARAVVIAVAEYPGLNPAGVANLLGPDNDAEGVITWLKTAGGLADRDITAVRPSVPAGAAPPYPPHAVVQAAFMGLAQEAHAGGRQPFDDRLYIYLSGHGFAPEVNEPALYTADATALGPMNIFAHAWFKWFVTAGYFTEVVLWMDCCMTWQPSIDGLPVPLTKVIGTPSTAFTAIAARQGSALEAKMPDGKFHGVFTWTLLQGLNGAACNAAGRISGDSLRDYLYNNMKSFVPKDIAETNAVDLHPYVVSQPGFGFFGQPQQQPKYKVTLTSSAPAGSELRIWGGAPVGQIISATVDPGWTGQMARGLYFAEVPAAGISQGFEVTGSGDVNVALTHQDAPVDSAALAGQHWLNAQADQSPAAVLSVIDASFERIAAGTGSLGGRYPGGIYKIRAEIGRDNNALQETIVCLDRQRMVSVSPPPIPSPAPIAGSMLTHEYHQAAFDATKDRAVRSMQPGQSAFALMARYWTTPEGRKGLKFPHPFEGLTLRNPAGDVLFDLIGMATLEGTNGGDPVASAYVDVAPGTYYLRQALPDGREFETALFARPDWLTQLVIRRATTDAVPENPRVASLGELTLFMRKRGGTLTLDDSILEAARIALAQGRNLFAEGRGQELKDMLFMKYQDPLAGIMGAHLLLITQAVSPTPSHQPLFDTVVGNLRGLVGDAHPDVEALSLKASPTFRTRHRFNEPPIFRRSWQLIVDASRDDPDLLDPDVWERVRATLSVAPYLVWASDDATRRAHQHGLEECVRVAHDVYAQPEEAPLRDAIPAGARTMMTVDEGTPAAAVAAPGSSEPPEALSDTAGLRRIPAFALRRLWKQAGIRRAPQ